MYNSKQACISGRDNVLQQCCTSNDTMDNYKTQGMQTQDCTKLKRIFMGSKATNVAVEPYLVEPSHTIVWVWTTKRC